LQQRRVAWRSSGGLPWACQWARSSSFSPPSLAVTLGSMWYGDVSRACFLRSIVQAVICNKGRYEIRNASSRRSLPDGPQPGLRRLPAHRRFLGLFRSQACAFRSIGGSVASSARANRPRSGSMTSLGLRQRLRRVTRPLLRPGIAEQFRQPNQPHRQTRSNWPEPSASVRFGRGGLTVFRKEPVAIFISFQYPHEPIKGRPVCYAA